MRRGVPVGITLVALALVLAAAAVSLARAPRYSYFAPPPAGAPRAVADLHASLSRTMRSPGFVLRVNGLVVDYAAPDRTEVRFVNTSEVIIGRTLYVTHSSGGGGARWTEARLATLDVPFAPVWVRRLLTPYLRARSVVRRGDTFEVRLVVPASQFVPEDAGQSLLAATVSTKDGSVVGVRAVVYGRFPEWPFGARRPEGRIDAASYAFSSLGQPPRIVAPRGDVVRGSPCGHGPGWFVSCFGAS
ncbi:MAG TPA: hypothetical protein PLS29_01935 [Acidimicrobiales bacterium]|nr:MAG: hypothetical protein B7Z69_02310 [Actinobacteria bacterium 21-73-9]HQU25772.1 hypothetical protein [Acidimicrobiales bacterium]